MPKNPVQVAEILQRAEEILATARQGLADVMSGDRSRRTAGLHNLIVFGRSVTFILQNLRSAVDGFDEWYEPEQNAMKADPLMKFMNNARTEILKVGVLNVGTSAHITSFDSRNLRSRPAPPGAKSFFIGDPLGGSGWIVELPDGTEERYYDQLPDGVMVSQHFLDIPSGRYPELQGLTVEDGAQRFIGEMAALIQRARIQFLPDDRQKAMPHLRLVKG